MNTLQVRYSDDGGENRSDWRDLSLGSTGSFLKTLEGRGWGQTRQRIWEFQDTSYVAGDIIAVSIMVNQ